MAEDQKIVTLHKSSSTKLQKRFTKQDLDEIIQAAEVKKANLLFKDAKDAEGSKKLLEVFGNDAAKACNSKAVYGAVKDRNRAQEKVINDYGGDWYELKDVVRMTLIAENAEALTKVEQYIKTKCVPKNGLGLIKAFPVSLETSPCGYTGWNFVILLENRRPAEIQANVPRVMYGQFSQSTFESIVGKDVHAKIKQKYGIEGGLGHLLYEIFRLGPQDLQKDPAKCREPKIKSTIWGQAAEASTAYFNYLRGKPDEAARAQTQQLLDAIMKTKEWKQAVDSHKSA